MSKKLYGLLLPVLAIAALSGAPASAFAAEWEPSGAKVAIGSTNLEFTATATGGPVTLKCASTTGSSTTVAGSANLEFIPVFRTCTAKVKPGTAKWNAKAISATQANLEIPTAAAEIEITPTCFLIVEKSTLGAAGDWTTGVNSTSEPSIWSLSGTVAIKESKANCFNTTTAQTTATVSAIALVYDQTNTAVAVKP